MEFKGFSKTLINISPLSYMKLGDCVLQIIVDRMLDMENCNFFFLKCSQAPMAQSAAEAPVNPGVVNYQLGHHYFRRFTKVNAIRAIHLPLMCYQPMWKSNKLLGKNAVWSTGGIEPLNTRVGELAAVV